jgi:acetyl-CoA synthetase
MSEKESISVLSSEQRTFPPSKEASEKAHIGSMEEYDAMYKKSVEDPEGFWGEIAEKNITWYKKWDKVLEYDFQKPEIKWFVGGKLNASVNCLDRHLEAGRRNKAAIIWEADDGSYKTYTYGQLHLEVNRFANVLKKNGVSRGDRVSIYMPMIPELAIAMLACARLGAIHSITFGGFSAQALRDRIQDCEAKMVITSDKGVRGGKLVPLKTNADNAVEECPSVEKMIVVRRAGDIEMKQGRDVWWHEEMAAEDIENYCEPEQMDSEDPLFILYTSGSTGKPKGVLHTTGGYMVYTQLTFKYIFDYHEEDTWFCTADIGWVTGHSYIVYGPLADGATSIMFEGVPTYPNPGRFWEMCDKHQVNQIYTAPTVIRALMRSGEAWPNKYDLSSLRLLGLHRSPGQ